MIEGSGLGAEPSIVIQVIVALVTALMFYLLLRLLRRLLGKYDWNRTTVKLPSDPDDIVQRLSKVSDEGHFVTRLYPEIAKYAGAELLPKGVVLMLALAVEDFGSNYPPPTRSIIWLYLPQFLDALIPNKSAARFAKEWLKKMEAEAEEKRKARTPPRKEPKRPIEDDELFAAVGKIIGIFFDELERWDTKKTIWVERRDEGVNPFYNQTETGLFLEFYYGHPSQIWTPWGHVKFTGSVSCSGISPWDKINDAFLERLGAKLFVPEKHEKWGVYGPVFAIHKVDEMELPEPQLRERQDFLEYEVAKEAYENMAGRVQIEPV
jgi:hypothetical protein